ncbi:MAG: hypothetical protein LUC94_03045, partial [Clostridiales bacterium]|nr:hypothetical protein [Clostridiales bacterium]
WIQNEDGTWRYADGNGQMAIGRFVNLDGERYYFDEDGLLVENQWFSIRSTGTEPSKGASTTWYYAGEHGRMYKGGWFTVGEGTFYFGKYGNATRSGLFTLEEDTGEVDENGEAVTISKKYYMDATYGKHTGGWFSIDKTDDDGNVTTKWYYADAEGSLYYGGFREIDGNVYYFDGSGVNYRDQCYVNSKTQERYYLGADGILQESGWYRTRTTNATTGVTTESWFYGYGQGNVAKDGFVQIGEYTYYFDANGRSYRKRWYVDAETKERYYLNEEGHLQTGWFDITSVNATTGLESVATYYANADGSVWKGNQYLEVDGRTYYFTTNGSIAKKRWMVDAGKGRKYLNENGVMMENEWFSISGTSAWSGAEYTYWYYATEGGRVLRAGWHTIGEKQYYFGSSGIMQTGWVDGNRYYCGEEDGARVYGWQFLPLKESWLVSDEEELMEYVGNYGDSAWFYFSPLTGRVYYSEEDTYKEIQVDGETYCVDERGIIQQGWIWMRYKSPTIRGFKYYMEAEDRGDSYAVTLVAGEHMVLEDVRAASEEIRLSEASPSNASPSDASPSNAGPAGGTQTTEWKVGQKVSGGWYQVVGPDEDSTGNEEWFYFKESGYPESAARNKEEVLILDHKRYLMNDQGNALTGFREVDGNIYYFDKDTLAAVTGRVFLDDPVSSNSSGLWPYYFKENGVGYTGVHSGSYYYRGKMQAADKTAKYQAFDLPDVGVRLLDSSGRIVRGRTVKDGDDNEWVTAASGEIKEYGNRSVSDVIEPVVETGD